MPSRNAATQLAPLANRESCVTKMIVDRRGALSHYDRPSRKRVYAQIEKLLAGDAPFIFLLLPRQIEPVKSDLKESRPNGIIEKSFVCALTRLPVGQPGVARR
jgi:hypothetical protein